LLDPLEKRGDNLNMPSREFKTIVATTSTHGIFISPAWVSENKMFDELGK
jgi:hypothetical protein